MNKMKETARAEIMEQWQKVKVTDTFWSRRQKEYLRTMLEHQWKALNDRCEGGNSHAVRNWKIAAGKLPKQEIACDDFGKDSDIGKWIEAAAAYVFWNADKNLEAQIDEVVDLMEEAQSADGYLNSFYLSSDPTKRFTSISEMHEMYCLGHLAEAAVTYALATGKEKFLHIVCRALDLLIGLFGPNEGQISACPGHEEIELALIRVYGYTGEKKYLDFAEMLVRMRGTNHYYEQEPTFRKGSKYFSFDYYQAHLPLARQNDAVGHCVRALYFYCGATDLARLCGDTERAEQLKKLFTDVTERKMYVTGGVGAHAVSERFSLPYDLPSDRAYSETCASIALALWARRMLTIDLNERYAAAMERALYNTVLAGMSSDGTKYFYVNPLAVDPAVAEFRSDCDHVKTERVGWFGCACCPPNMARTLAEFGDYIFTVSENAVALNLYVAAELSLPQGTVRLSGNLSKSGKFELSVPQETAVWVRIPYWADRVTADGKEVPKSAGYYKLESGDHTIMLHFAPHWVYGDARVADTAGCAALQYGPYVYCVEECDNGKNLHALSVDTAQPFGQAGEYGGLPIWETKGLRTASQHNLYSDKRPQDTKTTIRWIPYFLWNNRGRGEMRVWLRSYHTKDRVENP